MVQGDTASLGKLYLFAVSSIPVPFHRKEQSMEQTYLLVGSKMSPYSIKVQSYMDYKSVPYTWEERTLANSGRFKQAGVRPLVPLLLCPDGTTKQDSTLIIEDEIEPIIPLTGDPACGARRYVSLRFTRRICR